LVALGATWKAEILTPGGLQGATLYGEDFIYSLLAKHKPELLVEAAKAMVLQAIPIKTKLKPHKRRYQLGKRHVNILKTFTLTFRMPV